METKTYIQTLREFLKGQSAEKLFKDAFAPATYRSPRSEAYKRGVRFQLGRIIDGWDDDCPYKEGTAERDAFFSGVQEGWNIAERTKDKLQPT